MGRERIAVSRIIRELKWTNVQRKHLIDRVAKTVDHMRQLDRQMHTLEEKYGSTRSEELKKQYRRQQKNCKEDLEKLEADSGLSYGDLRKTQRKIIESDMAAEQAKEVPAGNVELMKKHLQEFTAAWGAEEKK